MGYVDVDGCRIFVREVGGGHPIIVLHGGPSFDHHYLLPELDSLADEFRLICHDQRGRGRSADGVRSEDVSLDSEMDDLDSVRRHLALESVTLLGHSWGGLLAMEYAARHPERVSHVVLLNTAPASAADFLLFKARLLALRTMAGEAARFDEIASTHAFQRGDIGVESDYYRIHFRSTVSPHRLDEVVDRLRANVTPQGIVLARAIAERLYADTWSSEGYDLIPALHDVAVPTLLVHGGHDFVPVELARNVADAMPDASLVVVPDCGHFSFLEVPEEVHRLVAALVTGTSAPGPEL